jgi:DNA-binding transcriptional LysR family regulator
MNNVKKLSSLLIFAEVANQQSFTVAAEKLSMSKSAVSSILSVLNKTLASNFFQGTPEECR